MCHILNVLWGSVVASLHQGLATRGNGKINGGSGRSAKTEISLNIEEIKQTRQYLIKQLNTFSEIRAYTSEGNFVLVNTEEQIIEQIRYEFEINNIYTRDLSHIQGMNGFFRITVGTRRSAERIIAILRQVLR